MPLELLKKYFGYESFRGGQSEIIDAILEGRDCMAVMPTGSGKSICYQIPALIMPGITLVISPLISLMQDQVKILNEAGIKAAYINSSLSEAQISRALGNARNGIYKIIYVAPERLKSYGFARFAADADISMVTVDEAHCISQWGQDFRPSYLEIVEFIASLRDRPVVSAFTATATPEVKEDVIRALHLHDPYTIVTGFDRPNLYFEVDRGTAKSRFVLKYIMDHPTDSGIIYCSTRKIVERLYEKLTESGIQVTRYHAGLSSSERKSNQDDFIYDRKPVMVATNAFGMGIDKSNVRFVIHYNMPQSIENYYQEAGRAGRDGEDAQCILLFSTQDIVIDRLLIDNKDLSAIEPEEREAVRIRDNQRLSLMEQYCRYTGCLRSFLLRYFGESAADDCGNCSNCRRELRETDMTAEARAMLNCVYELRGRYGKAVVIGTLYGSKRERYEELGLYRYKTYGILRGKNRTLLRMLMDQLIEQDYLYQTEGRYSVIRLGKNAARLRDSEQKFIVKVFDEPQAVKKSKKTIRSILTAAGQELFEALRALRTEISREEGIPPYIVFNDRTLADMAAKAPKTPDEMMRVSGVGEAKLQKYGERFLNAIRECPASKEVTSEEYVTEISDSRKKLEYALTQEAAANFEFAQSYSSGEIRDILNSMIDTDRMKKLTAVAIERLLAREHVIEEKESANGTILRFPTKQGKELGITCEKRVSERGTVYNVLRYPEEVQRLIIVLLLREAK